MCVMHERGDRVGLIITGFLGQEYGWCMCCPMLYLVGCIKF